MEIKFYFINAHKKYIKCLQTPVMHVLSLNVCLFNHVGIADWNFIAYCVVDGEGTLKSSC